MLENYSMRELESALSAASARADEAARSGDIESGAEALAWRKRVQNEVNLRHAQHSLNCALSSPDPEALDCAMSELRLARAACTGAAFASAGASVQGVRQP